MNRQKFIFYTTLFFLAISMKGNVVDAGAMRTARAYAGDTNWEDFYAQYSTTPSEPVRKSLESAYSRECT